jgi:uncharacterized protein (TIGR02001 family)
VRGHDGAVASHATLTRTHKRLPILILLLMCAAAAHAQVSFDVGLASDNNYRGASLNDGHAVPLLNLSWDGDSGLYANAFATQARFYRHNHASAQFSADAGYARRTASGLTWEVGAITSVFSGASNYNYSEAFAGLLGERWSARLYFSDDYYGRDRRTAYAEFNYTQPLPKHFRVFAHVGGLRILSGAAPSGDKPMYDAALGAGLRLGRADVQVRWVNTSNRGYLYPVAASGPDRKWVTSVTFGF